MADMTGQPWTTEDVRELERMYVAGFKYLDIAYALERVGRRPRAMIWAALDRFGIYAKHGYRINTPKRKNRH